ncbi:protein SLOW GREEN 1, chloroplastic isoform X1 [Sesamum indicum]|uniref:Protein SLOW GREEN 1, chloroplastic isoform X1 n=1 Tax=Sesamum indicum TaxID=4182 RepID=A0A6I9UY67_SESIN|nr:protein SLOW GREEN 1, chloroplastic isoform X1 [Sesamum indicum]
MAALSLGNFTLSSHCYMNHSHKFSLPTTHILSSSSSLCYPPKLRQPVRKLLVSQKPTSKPSVSALFSPPQKSISKFFAESIATVLLGSLVFMGCLKSRPVLAQPVQESDRVEEKKGSRLGGSSDSEEEVMCVKLLQENPRDVEALKMVVNVKMKKGKTSEAVEYVERLIELQPNEMEWRLLQALCYEMMGNLSKAKSLFKNILKQKPLLLRALHGLAMVMHKNHEGPAVFEMLERALEVARRQKKVNEERNIRILVAQMHIIKGDFEEALEKFQALIDENPRDFRPYLCQGIVYSLLDKRKEADANFEIYRSLVPEEFPQRGFLDDVVLAAKTESKQKLRKELQR